MQGISVINPNKYDPLDDPYSSLRRGHPLASVRVAPFVLGCANAQINGPAYGNVAISLKMPVNLVLQGKMKLFYVEFQGGCQFYIFFTVFHIQSYLLLLRIWRGDVQPAVTVLPGL